MIDVTNLTQPRKMTRSDLRQVVELHAVCFPDYFLSGLGNRVLRDVYSYALDDPQSAAAILEVEATARIVGLAVGTFDPKFQPTVFRSYLVDFMWGFVRGLYTSDAVRKGAVRRLWDMKWAVKSLIDGLVRRKGLAKDISPKKNTYACLLVNAVHPEWRGWRNSERFLKHFTDWIFQMGATGIWGTVYPENLAALILYKRLRWNIKKTSDRGVIVWLNREEVRS